MTVRFKIHFDEIKDRKLYQEFCEFIYEEVVRSVKESINPLKYHVREKDVLASSLIKWVHRPPKSINLPYYVENCLVLVKEKGEYVIQIDTSMRVHYSKTPVSTLIRLLEFGNEKVKPLPVIRRVLAYYQNNYPYLVKEFIKRKVMNDERVPLRAIARQESTRDYRRLKDTHN